MEIPVLRYLDILIGLAVVALLVSTIVTSATQLLLSLTYTRSRNLRKGLTDLISQVEPSLLSRDARYIAERLLRHPLVARDNTPFGHLGWLVRSHFRGRRSARLPLPGFNPPDAIQREELVLMLLEWAGEDGALAQQDRELAAIWPEAEERLKALRERLRAALRNRGIGDAAGTAQNIRLAALRSEAANPGQQSQFWRLQAVSSAAPADFVARLYSWFDNSMARTTQAYALTAKIVACFVAGLIVFLLQVDGINLLRRLSTDDKLRASLVTEAQLQVKRMEETQTEVQKSGAAPASPEAVQKLKDSAKERDKIAASMAALRDPSRDIVPSYWLWNKVAQSRVCRGSLGSGLLTGTLIAGTEKRPISVDLGTGGTIDLLSVAIHDSGAPVAVYSDDPGCLRLVARSDSAATVVLQSDKGQTLSFDHRKRIDRMGFKSRLAGILLMWVLVTLGAPFWYDLLKKLLRFRSIVATKDEEERKARQAEQTPPSAATAASSTAPAAAAVAGGSDERGDLSATGAEG